MRRLLPGGLLASAVLCACTSTAPLAPATSAGTASVMPHYRCDHGIDLTVRFGDDTAVVDAGSRGSELLLRDAGGVTPQQTIYSNPRLRAEFGLGASGGEAILHYFAPPLEVHCRRDAGR